GADGKLHVDRRLRCERAVDLFRRGGGDDEPRAGLDGHVEREAIAACDAAGGVDDDGFGLARCPPPTAHAQRAALAHPRAPRRPRARPNAASPGRWGGPKARCRPRRGSPQTYEPHRLPRVPRFGPCRHLKPNPCRLRPAMQAASQPRTTDKKGGSPQMAIARLSAASSIVSRLQE